MEPILTSSLTLRLYRRGRTLHSIARDYGVRISVVRLLIINAAYSEED